MFLLWVTDMDTIADAVKDKFKDKIGLFTTVYEKIRDFKEQITIKQTFYSVKLSDQYLTHHQD